MFFYIIYNIILSVIIIFIIHNIFNYLKNTLTSPKVKDLIYKPKTSYEKINEVINKQSVTDYNIDNNIDSSKIINSKHNTFDSEVIKSELKDFFNELNDNIKNKNLDLDDYKNLDNYETINNNVYSNNF